MLLGRAGRSSALDAHTNGVVPDLALCVVNQPVSREDTFVGIRSFDVLPDYVKDSTQ